MNEVYTRKRNSDRRRKRYIARRIGKHFLKQLSAVFVCTALVLGMKSLPATKLNAYSTALGRAVRHETNMDMFTDLYESLKDVFGINGETAPNGTVEGN